ncbi:MAG TPA: hypothetical protein VFC24_08135 [Casimicrobiaceae bacterium]|nr:hypothetical protein [Casimicrobiaceae bacterium]
MTPHFALPEWEIVMAILRRAVWAAGALCTVRCAACAHAMRDAIVAAGWLAEDDGPNLVVMCVPT